MSLMTLGAKFSGTECPLLPKTNKNHRFFKTNHLAVSAPVLGFTGALRALYFMNS
jgi:hypothetical protein